jgi:hypothetical protein
MAVPFSKYAANRRLYLRRYLPHLAADKLPRDHGVASDCEPCPDRPDGVLRSRGISARNTDGFGWGFRIVISWQQCQDQAVSMACPDERYQMETILKMVVPSVFELENLRSECFLAK